MANFIYNSYKNNALAGSVALVTDTIKVMLVTSSYTPNIDTDQFASTPAAFEASGIGYTAGGATLTTKSITTDTTNDRAYLDADDTSWPTSTITARYAVLYKSTGTLATSPLIGYIIFLDGGGNPANKSTNGDTFYIQWATPATGGILYLT